MVIFDVTYVGFAVIWGVMFFGERPDALTLTGVGLIVLAGVLSLRLKIWGSGSASNPVAVRHDQRSPS